MNFLMVISIILIAVIIFDHIGKNGIRILRKLEFTLSLPGVPILLSFVHGLQIALGYTELVKYLLTFTERFEGPSRFIVGTDMYVVLTKPEDYKSVLSNTNGNYKSSATILWQSLLGDGIIRVSVTFAGIEETAQKGDYDDVLHWQKRLFKLTYDRSIRPWLYADKTYSITGNAKQMRFGLNILESFIYNVHIDIEQRPELVFLEQLFENVVDRNDVTDQDFKDDIKNLYLAAQSTMTELTHFVLLMLAMHPEIQDTLRKEISTLDNETINSSCLLRMRYLHMVIKETLRLFPIAPLMVRELTGDIKLESCTLPDGCYVMVPIYAIHRNPKYWDHPNEFIPERFAPENSLNHNRDAYLPFGSGIRSCPGKHPS
ncbi:hypothetical protein DMN91_006744 [Ooceraea biroi]|uniref:Cytochrome P450 4C1 n=1 Tax=Ooceraea biroi TaxID=2015173 RepID=A0A3L8DJU5_OOCBI|nr:hypothetical protein DMN91_006744 [Ooceraea biroi]